MHELYGQSLHEGYASQQTGGTIGNPEEGGKERQSIPRLYKLFTMGMSNQPRTVLQKTRNAFYDGMHELSGQ